MSGQRLRTDFWGSAYLRRSCTEGVGAVLRRRGAAEAGAVMIKIDRLDGTATLLGPAPQGDPGIEGERRFVPVHRDDHLDGAAAEQRLAREIGFDSHLWIIEVEDRAGRSFL